MDFKKSEYLVSAEWWLKEARDTPINDAEKILYYTDMSKAASLLSIALSLEKITQYLKTEQHNKNLARNC